MTEFQDGFIISFHSSFSRITEVNLINLLFPSYYLNYSVNVVVELTQIMSHSKTENTLAKSNSMVLN